MSSIVGIGVGPAFDAEVAYRQQQVRSQFHRTSRRQTGSTTSTPARRTRNGGVALRFWTPRAA